MARSIALAGLRLVFVLTAVAGPLIAPTNALAVGARLFKSGPIQITADGSTVWTANPDNGSVSRLETLPFTVSEMRVDDCGPRGVSVREDGAEVWATCEDGDSVVALDPADGSLRARIPLGHGSSPAFVALSPDQGLAIVTLHRSSAVAVIDVTHRNVLATLPTWQAPLGVAWTRDGRSAFVTHAFSDGDRTFVTRIDVTGGVPRVAACIPIGRQEPHASSIPTVGPPFLAEGGAVTLRGHLAQLPVPEAGGAIWLPAQHSGTDDVLTNMNTTIQAAVHRLDPVTGKVDPRDRLVLTAVQAHDPTGADSTGYPGWDAPVAGFVDIAFSADGSTAWLAGENSENVLVVPTDLAPWKANDADPALLTIDVGQQPTGIAASPSGDSAFVYDALDREIVVVEPGLGRMTRRIDATPLTRLPAAANVLLGRRIFSTSALPQASGNRKVACASCHWNGEHDGLIWHFENLPTHLGPRSTTSMLGLARTFGPVDPVTRLGQLHRAGDRDEIQDFEHTFRDPQMGGTGFFVAPPNSYQGAPNSGHSPEVDAMAAYMLSLPPPARSPHRGPSGELTEAALRGAAMFASRGTRDGDAGCATCHDPLHGFSDLAFHDVGSSRLAEERQISTRVPQWQVNTPTLIGLWTTAPYDDAGKAGEQVQDLVDLLAEFATRDGTSTPHGHLGQLTRRQLEDMAAYLLSIDAGTTVAELQGARDTTPPRLVRAEPVSLTRIECWFSEPVERSSAGSSASWRVVADDGTEVRVLAATWNAIWGDRVTLTTEPMPRDCSGRTFTVVPRGIRDTAGSTSYGTANMLDESDASNVRSFALGDAITVTFGASGREDLDVAVHDAAMGGPENPDASENEPWLRRIAGPVGTKGFVRFEWEAAFRAATGVTSAADIVDASFTLDPQWGGAQTVLARRVLQRWSDPHAPDGDESVAGAPTWAEHARGAGSWNAPGALSRGGTGNDPADYFGAYDVAASLDATVSVRNLTERTSFGGPGIAAACRFWFDRPDLDMGHALELADGTASELRFHRAEASMGERGPVLAITYLLPVAGEPEPEVSADDSDRPLLVTRAGGDVLLSFAGDYVGRDHEVFEGTLGSFGSHAGLGCAMPASAPGGRLSLDVVPSPGNRYFLVGVSGPCGASLGMDSAGNARPIRFSDCTR